MIVNFTFNDIVLYSKGWYERKGNVVDDLGYLLSQVYGYYPVEEGEVAMYMLAVLDRLYEELREDGVRLDEMRWYASHKRFENEIRYRVSFYGYSRDMAIIYLVLSILQGLDRSEIVLNKPVYGKKCHFRMGGLFNKFPISMTYAEMNRIAERAFKM